VFECLHSKDIIYRDLKTENLLIAPSGYLKVADFGFAKRLDGSDKTWTLCGTPEHLAPEIIQNKGHNKAADWWTLGINIYEFLSGEPPFFDNTPIGTYRKIIAGELQFGGEDSDSGDPEDFSADAQDLITQMLSKEPSQRLGCGKRGARDVKEHPFFATMDWVRIVAAVAAPAAAADPLRASAGRALRHGARAAAYTGD